eukprot:10622886-Lingulodinium_polyedra.AAC.1
MFATTCSIANLRTKAPNVAEHVGFNPHEVDAANVPTPRHRQNLGKISLPETTLACRLPLQSTGSPPRCPGN